MVRYYFPLLSFNLLSIFQLIFLGVLISLFRKLHVNIVQDLLSTTLPCLLLITHKVSLSFFNSVLNTLFIANCFSRYLFVHILFTFEKQGLLRISALRDSFGSIIFSLTVSTISLTIYIHIYM